MQGNAQSFVRWLVRAIELETQQLATCQGRGCRTALGVLLVVAQLADGIAAAIEELGEREETLAAHAAASQQQQHHRTRCERASEWVVCEEGRRHMHTYLKQSLCHLDPSAEMAYLAESSASSALHCLQTTLESESESDLS